MANSAFGHEPTITVPGSSTDNAVVRFNQTTGGSFQNSGVLIDDSNNIVIPGAITLGGTAISSTAAEINLLDALDRGSILYGNASGATAVLGQGSNGQVLTSDGTDISWQAAGGGAVSAVANGADNRIATFSSSDALNGEASLTFDNAALAFDRDHDGNNAINLINDSNTSSASTRLTIQTGGASAGDAVALFHAGGQSYIIGVDNSDDNKFKISATGGNLGTNDALTIIPDGSGDGSNNAYFGIGTSTPVRPLDIRYSQSRAQLRLARTGSATGIANLGAGDGMFSIMDSGYTRRFSVETSGGRIGIGLANSTVPTDTFIKASWSTQSWVYNFTNAHSTGANHIGQMNFSGFAPDSPNNLYLYCADNQTARCIIYSDGDILNHDGSYGQMSDERIKEDIRDANSQWDDVKAIRVRNFKRKEDIVQYGDRAWEQLGVVAQEVELISPKLISEKPPTKFEMEQLGMGHEIENGENETKWVPNVDEDGNEVTIKSMKYSILHMKAFKALQEAMTRIEILEAEVDSLKA